MSDPINLRQVRKAKNRLKKRVKANENAAKFGLTRAERDVEASRAKKARRDHEAHKRE